MVAQIMETASLNGHGIVAQVDDVTVDQAVTSAEKALVNAAFTEVTATDVLGAMSMFGLVLAEVADDASISNLKDCSKL